MKLTTFLFITLFLCTLVLIPSAQEASKDTSTGYNPPPTEEVSKQELRSRTDIENRLTYAVLIFGLIIISIEMLLITLGKIDSQDAMKFIIVTLIIIGTLFLITAGWSNDQIAPAFGLLGTIAGYLLGKQKTEK